MILSDFKWLVSLSFLSEISTFLLVLALLFLLTVIISFVLVRHELNKTKKSCQEVDSYGDN